MEICTDNADPRQRSVRSVQSSNLSHVWVYGAKLTADAEGGRLSMSVGFLEVALDSTCRANKKIPGHKMLFMAQEISPSEMRRFRLDEALISRGTRLRA